VTIKVERAEAPLAGFYMSKQPWTAEAACLGFPISMFYEETEQLDTSARLAATKRVKAICFNCPVRRACAEQVMVEEGSAPSGRYGYRGCLSPSQRRSLYRRGGLKGRDPKRSTVQSIR